MCSFWDVMPTFREILNPKAKNQQMDGVSLLPLLENRKGQKEHEYLYFEFQEMNGRQAVRKGPWKLVHMNVRGKTRIRALQPEFRSVGTPQCTEPVPGKSGRTERHHAGCTCAES